MNVLFVLGSDGGHWRSVAETCEGWHPTTVIPSRKGRGVLVSQDLVDTCPEFLVAMVRASVLTYEAA